MLLDPLDPELEDLYRMYKYCKLFGATPTEYEERPFKEVTWLLEIDSTYTQAVNEVQDSGR